MIKTVGTYMLCGAASAFGILFGVFLFEQICTTKNVNAVKGKVKKISEKFKKD